MAVSRRIERERVIGAPVVGSAAVGDQEARPDTLDRFTYPPTTNTAVNRVIAAYAIETNILMPVANDTTVKPTSKTRMTTWNWLRCASLHG
jgi:hypothetical protein